MGARAQIRRVNGLIITDIPGRKIISREGINLPRIHNMLYQEKIYQELEVGTTYSTRTYHVPRLLHRHLLLVLRVKIAH